MLLGTDVYMYRTMSEFKSEIRKPAVALLIAYGKIFFLSVLMFR